MTHSSVPLSTLRGFAAAARLASFADAARELHLSHSAVSHQMKQLESELGQPLFRRVGRSVVLTDAGKDFARTVRDVLDRLDEGVARLAPYRKPSSVVLYTTSEFARGFILPRMTRLHDELPGLDLWLDTGGRAVDFDQDEVDIVITNAEGTATNGMAGSARLADARAALASPELAHRLRTLGTDRWPLLHDEGRTTWREWFARAGLSTDPAVQGTNFSDHTVMIEAAVAGHGAALGGLICAAPHLRSGSLVILPGPQIAQADYRIHRAASARGDDQIDRVFAWFERETYADSAAVAATSP